MYRLRDTAEQHRFQATYLSVADVNTEIAFVEKLYQAVQPIEAAASIFKRLAEGHLGSFVKRITLRKASFSGITFEFSSEAAQEWEQLGQALMRSLDRLESRWLVLVDELPIFILSLLRQDPTAARARHFLNWFRQLRLGPEGSEHIRWLLAGSIGLDTVTEVHNLGDTINDLHIIGLGAFETAVAERFLENLAESYGLPLDAAARDRLLTRVGWPIPFFLQLIFSELRGLFPAPESITPQIVDQAFTTLLQPSRRSHFDYWRQRLHEQLGSPDAGRAIHLLTAIAQPPGGASRDILLQQLAASVPNLEERERQLHFLMRVLQGDGYIVRVQQRYVFRSPLLRTFWLHDD